MGAFVGFLVALFTEMYGFPLTIFFLTSLRGKNYPVLDPFFHPSGHLVLVFLGLAHAPPGHGGSAYHNQWPHAVGAISSVHWLDENLPGQSRNS